MVTTIVQTKFPRSEANNQSRIRLLNKRDDFLTTAQARIHARLVAESGGAPAPLSPREIAYRKLLGTLFNEEQIEQTILAIRAYAHDRNTAIANIGTGTLAGLLPPIDATRPLAAAWVTTYNAMVRTAIPLPSLALAGDADDERKQTYLNAVWNLGDNDYNAAWKHRAHIPHGALALMTMRDKEYGYQVAKLVRVISGPTPEGYQVELGAFSGVLDADLRASAVLPNNNTYCIGNGYNYSHRAMPESQQPVVEGQDVPMPTTAWVPRDKLLTQRSGESVTSVLAAFVRRMFLTLAGNVRPAAYNPTQIPNHNRVDTLFGIDRQRLVEIRHVDDPFIQQASIKASELRTRDNTTIINLHIKPTLPKANWSQGDLRNYIKPTALKRLIKQECKKAREIVRTQVRDMIATMVAADQPNASQEAKEKWDNLRRALQGAAGSGVTKTIPVTSATKGITAIAGRYLTSDYLLALSGGMFTNKTHIIKNAVISALERAASDEFAKDEVASLAAPVCYPRSGTAHMAFFGGADVPRLYVPSRSSTMRVDPSLSYSVVMTEHGRTLHQDDRVWELDDPVERDGVRITHTTLRPLPAIGGYHSGKDIVGFVADPTQPKASVFMGFEWEHCYLGSNYHKSQAERNRDARLIKRRLTIGMTDHDARRYAHVENDGSLSDYNGFEVVTGYTTLAKHREQLAKFVEAGGLPDELGDRHNKVGIHVHISRTGSSYDHYDRILRFVSNRRHTRLVDTIARREANSYAKRSSMRELNNRRADVAGNVIYHKQGRRNENVYARTRLNETLGGDRYDAVGLCGHTYEFRIFRSTRHVSELLVALEFTHAVYWFTKYASRLECTEHHFLQWISKPENRKDTRELRKFLSAKGYKVWMPNANKKAVTVAVAA